MCGGTLPNQGASARRIRCQVGVRSKLLCFSSMSALEPRCWKAEALNAAAESLDSASWSARSPGRGVEVGGRGVVEGGLDPVVLGLVDELGLASKFLAVSSFIVWPRQAVSSLISFILTTSLASGVQVLLVAHDHGRVRFLWPRRGHQVKLL